MFRSCKPIENVVNLTHLGTTVTNQNYCRVYEGNKIGLIQFRIVCLPVNIKGLKIKRLITINVPIVSYENEAWFETFQHRLRMSENGMMRLTFGPEKEKAAEG
jgi:hypothetical protein